MCIKLEPYVRDLSVVHFNENYLAKGVPHTDNFAITFFFLGGGGGGGMMKFT